MEFFNSAIEVLQTLVVALGAGLGVWGAINLLEGYGNDNPGSKPAASESNAAGRPGAKSGPFTFVLGESDKAFLRSCSGRTLSVSMIPSCGCGLAQEQRGLSPRFRR